MAHWPLLLTLLAAPAQADGPRYERRWFYAMFNLQVGENADRLIGLIDRAAAAGYNGVVLADYKLAILDRVPDHYFQNVARVKAAADRAGVAIIPAVFPIGYSNGLLAHDPNLAEGLPAEAEFVVRGGRATLAPDPAVRIQNGDLEQARGDTFAGFNFQDGPGKASFADRDTHHGGSTSCRMQDTDKAGGGGNCRLIQKVAVRPRHAYRLSCWARTRDLANPGAFRLLALGAQGGRPLTFYEGGLERDQDWKEVEVVFNALDQAEVNLYVGLWGGSAGTLWVDDLKLEELGLVNVLRRPGCPFEVRSADGRTEYAEGRDFEPVADPKLGRVPYAGEYEFGHKAPALRLVRGAPIKDGDRLKVSWYHPVLTHGSQIMCCLSEPKVYDLLRDQVRRVNELLKPKTFFMSHDEIRVVGWCRACRERGLTPGALLAENARRCSGIIRTINPNAEAVVWSDMFDPNHNAVAGYYLANGSLAGSWEGLDPAITVANWNGGKAAESLRFFAGRKHRQVIAGYYDGDLSGFARWDQAARGVPKVDGFMYTTWQQRFGDLEAFGRAMRRGKGSP